jgi:hypothetical protein
LQAIDAAKLGQPWAILAIARRPYIKCQMRLKEGPEPFRRKDAFCPTRRRGGKRRQSPMIVPDRVGQRTQKRG